MITRAASGTAPIRKGLLALFVVVLLALASAGTASAAVTCSVRTGDGINLTGCDLTGADLSHLTGATNLTNAIIKNATLPSASLVSWTLTGVASGGLKGTPTKLPVHFGIIKGWLVGPGAVIAGADFTGADLSDMSQFSAGVSDVLLHDNNRYQVFVGVKGSGITGNPMLGLGYKIVKGYLVGPGVNLTGANLTAADLSGVNLTLATLTGVVSGGVTGAPTLPAGFALLNGYLVGSGAVLLGADLHGTTISVSLAGLDLTNANLTGVTLGAISISNTDFTGATLTGIRTQLTAGAVPASPVNLTGVPKALPSGWKMISKVLWGPGANLSNLSHWSLNLDGVDLTGANLSGTRLQQLTGSVTLSPGYKIAQGYLVGPRTVVTCPSSAPKTTFTSEELSGVSFEGSQLTYCGLPAAPGAINLTGATFLSGDLSGVDLSSANLSGTLLKGFLGTPTLPTGWVLCTWGVRAAVGPGANITGLDLGNCNLSSADLTGVSGKPGSLSRTTAPTGWLVAGGYLVGPGVNLTNAILTSGDLRGIDLSGATLTGVTGSGLVGNSGTRLPAGWKVTAGFLVGPRANLSGKVITGADFSGVNLTGANLTGATITGLTANPATLPANYAVVGGTLIGPGMRIANVSVAGVDLSTVNLDGVSSSGLTGTPSHLPVGANLIGGILFAPRVSLKRESLPNLNLTGVDLTGADLKGANLEGANLTNANLTNADLTNASLAGAKLIGTNVSGTIMAGAVVAAMGDSTALDPYVRTTTKNLVGIPASFPGASSVGLKAIVKGYMVAAWLSLNSADLTGADLRGLDITNTDLTATKLAGASVDGLVTGDSVGVPAKLSPNMDYISGTLFAPGVVAVGTLADGANLAGLFIDGAAIRVTFGKGTRSGVINGVPSQISQSGTYVRGGYFVGPNMALARANLSNQDLTGVDFTGSDLSGANLGGAILVGSLLGPGVITAGIVGMPASLPSGAKMVGANIVAPGVSLTKAVLTNADMKNLDLQGVSFVGATLSGADFSGSNLTGADLTDAKVAGTKFGTATLANVKSSGLVGTPTSLPATVRLLGGFIIGQGVNLDGKNLTGLHLTGLNLDGSSFVGANLTKVVSGTVTGQVDMGPNCALVSGYLVGPGVDLSRVTALAGADLTGVDLTGANLGATNFTGTTLSNANLAKAQVAGALLSTANVSGLKSGALVGVPASLPSASYKIVGGYLVGPHVDLTSAALTAANLHAVDLTGVVFTHANLTGATLTGATITDADFGTDGYVEGEINGNAATLAGVISGTLVGNPAQVASKWIVVNGYLAGPGANLTGANFADVVFGSISYRPNGYNTLKDLTGANLTRADFSRASLSVILTKANLTGTIFGTASLGGITSGLITGAPKSLPVGFKIANGFLLGELSKLSGADLHGQNLKGVDLYGADLTKANLSGATLTDVDLTLANLGNEHSAGGPDAAKLSGVISGGLITRTDPTSVPVGWVIQKGYLVGPGANLTSADLSGVDFSTLVYAPNGGGRVALTGANLTSAVLAGVRLQAATWLKIIGTPNSLPTGWRLLRGTLSGSS
ncbi:MAG: pentapeptide repeat-containing protein [Solirubrobacterales bacterium]|nr:pentapeptide repeat-containing protein [Solirubrobacterales bacterium]